jgi:FAD/FMN-containing dehydrogenase
MSRRVWRLAFWAVALVSFSACRPAAHLVRTAWNDRDTRVPTPAGFADDASRMNRTAVAETWHVPADAAEAERQLVALVARARREGLAVSIAGARHSMGAHTIAAGGLVIDMLPFRAMSLSGDGRVLTVGSGALWSDVVPFLDARGRSVGVMQSDHSFSVGGSLSTNVHGWQTGRPPIASTVRSFRLVLADGHVVRCSRDENAELFGLVLGGYGLFGVILDAELWTVPNRWYSPERIATTADDYARLFAEVVEADSTVEMAYGRLSVAPSRFLRDGVLTVYRRATPEGDPKLPAPVPSPLEPLGRTVFRGSVGSDYGKELRWDIEQGFGPRLEPRYVPRNALLSGSVDVYTDRAEGRTEILHEYFLPADRLAAWLDRVRPVLQASPADLLNVTLRDVREDRDAALRYAAGDRIGVVMFYSQDRTPLADARMATLTRSLINAALAEGGTYYLPYRPHATRAQFARAYPTAGAFFAAKARFDPDTLFQNGFYGAYGPSGAGP